MSDGVIGSLVTRGALPPYIQGDEIRRMKEEGRPKLEIQAAVAELKARKKALEQKEVELLPKQEKFDRSGLEDLLKQRFFYTQSFAIYGGRSVRIILLLWLLQSIFRCGWTV